MKKLVFLLVALLLGTGAASAQGNLLNELKRQATNAVRNEVNRAKNNAQRSVKDAAKNAVRNAAENARNAASSNNNTASQQLAGEPVEVKEGAWTCPNCGKADNEGSFCPNCGTDRPDGNARPKQEEAAAGAAEEGAFVPGTSVIFEDTLSGESTNDSPSKWELLAASMYQCYVTTQAGVPAIWINGFHSDMKPKMKKEHYLPSAFTVEMDIWFDDKVPNASSHALELNFASEDVLEEFSAIFRFGSDAEESGSVGLRYYRLFLTGEQLAEDRDKVREVFKPGDWNHAAVSYDKGTVVLYVNGKAILQATQQKQPTYVRVDAVGSDQDHFIFRNFRIAAK